MAALALDRATAERAEDVARALEGNAMAIELSAPTAQLLGLEALRTRLYDAGPGGSGLEPVREPMRRMLDWSWSLLSEDERHALAQCAVFRGGFTVPAAEAVVRTAGDTLALLQALRDHSLLTHRPSVGAGEPRLAMPAPVRDLAWEKLRLAGTEDVLARHAAYFGQLHAWLSAPSGEALGRAERDADNLFAAAEFSLSDDAGDPAMALLPLMALEPAVVPRGATASYFALLDRALERLGLPLEAEAPAARLRQIRARFDGPAGRTARARADLALCLEAARRRGDADREGMVLLDLAVIHHLERDLTAAQHLYDEALAKLQPQGDPWAVGRCLGNLGALAHDQGRLADAASLYRQAIELLARAGDIRQQATFVGNLGALEQEIGDPEVARGLFERALALLEPIRDARLIAITLGNLGALELERGDAAHAVGLHERAHALLEGSGDVASRALGFARLAASLALAGRPAIAAARLAQAERMALGAGTTPAEMVALARAFVDVAAGREATQGGRTDAASASFASAAERVRRATEVRDEAGTPLLDHSDDLRWALRVLLPLLAPTP
jgi:tetratricopeptide (TPR) repeat protein